MTIFEKRFLKPLYFSILQKDIFEIPAVDLGKLSKVKVTHDGAGVGSGWLLDKVVVKETEDAKQQYVFSRDQ